MPGMVQVWGDVHAWEDCKQHAERAIEMPICRPRWPYVINEYRAALQTEQVKVANGGKGGGGRAGLKLNSLEKHGLPPPPPKEQPNIDIRPTRC